MIAFVGIPTEPPLAAAIAAAQARGLEHRVVNLRDAAAMTVELEARSDRVCARVGASCGHFALETCAGVYARTVEPGTLPELEDANRRNDEARRVHIETVCALLEQALDGLATTVVNPPSAMASNFSKPAQCQLITTAGLLVPPTLVSNDPDAVRAFHAEHGRIVFKSISAIRSIVREWSPASGPDLARIRSLPVQFQAFVPGDNVRVHVIGERSFATRIEAREVDYRYDPSARLEPATLPEDIAEACVALGQLLELPFAGIDLKRTADGRTYCFEVNPSPAYSFYQDHTGQPIADALVDYLARSTG